MMWVYNQDGIAVVQVNALYIDYRDVVTVNSDDVKEKPKMIRVWGQVNGADFVMGAYATLEKAKDVLVEYYSFVKQNMHTYHMPKDDSVVPDKEVQ